MFLGHYGLALAAKRLAPRTSLGALAFAAQWLDELWPLLLLAGVERVRVAPGLMAANALDFEHYPWSHSLLMAVLWGALVGAVYFAARRYGRGALVLGLLVASHWLLDLPMHRPDLPLWPGAGTRVGLGLWNSIPLSIAVEFLVFGAGIAAYVSRTRALDAVGRWGFRGMIALLLVFFATGATGAAPPSARAVALGALALWIFVPWCWWVDRHRALAR